MTASSDSVIDLQALRRSCADCSLRMLCLPAGIPACDFSQLEAVVRKPAPLKRAETLFRADQAFEHLYIVRSGALKTVQPAEMGETQVMAFHLPGELVGLDAISRGRHRCHAIALERTSVCAIPFSRLEQVAAEVPALQHQLHRIISREIGHDQEHLSALSRQTARARLALFLCDLGNRLEYAGYSRNEFRLSMSREEIGDYLGLALETVSRLFKKLVEEGYIELERRQVRVLHPSALAELAGRRPDGESQRTTSAGN